MQRTTQMQRRLRIVVNAWRALGIRSTLQWLLFRVNKKYKLNGPELWSVHPRLLPQSLKVKLRGSSNFDVFCQIFISEEYAPMRDLKNVSFIMDLGANVGYSSAYFLSRFPDAKVLAVEPDERNVAICRETLKPFGDRATVLHGAAWSESTTLSLSRGSYGDGREWATQVTDAPGGSDGSIQAWDVASLMKMAMQEQVDLLKVDIERAELAVFSDSAKSWLPNIRNICIELHGTDCDEVFFDALRWYDYELEHSGELTICRNLRSKVSVSEATA